MNKRLMWFSITYLKHQIMILLHAKLLWILDN